MAASANSTRRRACEKGDGVGGGCLQAGEQPHQPLRRRPPPPTHTHSAPPHAPHAALGCGGWSRARGWSDPWGSRTTGGTPAMARRCRSSRETGASGRKGARQGWNGGEHSTSKHMGSGWRSPPAPFPAWRARPAAAGAHGMPRAAPWRCCCTAAAGPASQERRSGEAVIWGAARAVHWQAAATQNRSIQASQRCKQHSCAAVPFPPSPTPTSKWTGRKRRKRRWRSSEAYWRALPCRSHADSQYCSFTPCEQQGRGRRAAAALGRDSKHSMGGAPAAAGRLGACMQMAPTHWKQAAAAGSHLLSRQAAHEGVKGGVQG